MVTIIGTAVSIPVIVAGSDVLAVLTPAPVCGANTKAAGVASAPTGAAVMVINGAETPPMVRLVVVVVELVAEALCRTVTVWPLVTVPAAEVNVPLLME